MKKLSILIIFVIALFTFGTLSAQADNAGLEENDTQVLTEQSASDKAFAETKLKETHKLIKIKNAVIEGKATEEDYKNAHKKFIQEFSTTRDLEPQNIVINKVLGVSTASQETSYYCGPASAYMLLKYLGVTKKPNTTKTLNQSNLAVDLKTTTDGTGWPGTWKSTLSSWMGYNYYAALSNPNESDVWATTVGDVDGDYPVIYDTVMNKTNGYLPGYSSGTIYHYVCGDGYQTDDYDTRLIHYVDPNGYRTGTLGPHWVNYNQMYKCVKDRGLIW